MPSRTPVVLLLLAVLRGSSAQEPSEVDLRLSLTPSGCRETTDRGEVVTRAVGEVWTRSGSCSQGECRLAYEGGKPAIEWEVCSPPSSPPFPDCELVPYDGPPAEFPNCCPKFRCPGRCFDSSLKRWFNVGDNWTIAGCQRATCGDTDSVGILPCGLIAVLPGCRAVPGDPEAEYPGCCHTAECGPDPERPCYDEKLDRYFAVGEEWTLSECGGQATCRPGGAVTAVGCPLEATDSPGCGLDDGDPSLEYPQCCPKITCKVCFSERHQRYFGPGANWTDQSCAHNHCGAGPYGAEVKQQHCDPLGYAPFPDCQLFDLDLARGDFPRCCSRFRCPGRCQVNGRWYSVGEQWNDGCSRAICIGTNWVERLACPQLRFDPYRRDCRLVEGAPEAPFPACCGSVQCDTPLNQCLDADGRGREVGEEWSEAGCSRARCEAAEGGVAVVRHSPCPPPPSADCYLFEDGREGEYPLCCPAYRCPGRCHSPLLGRWFSVGEEWTESGCIKSTCAGTGQVRQEPCPFIRPRRRGCRVVLGDLAEDYPGCCQRVECTGSNRYRAAERLIGEQNPYG